MTQGVPSTEEGRLAKNAKIAAALKGRTPSPATRRPEAHAELVEALVAEQVPVRQIAERSGLSEAAIYKRIAKHGWDYHPAPKTYNSKSVRQRDTAVAVFDRGVADGETDLPTLYRQVTEATGLSYEIGRKLLARERPAVVEGLRTRPVTSKACTSCRGVFALEAFARRGDRPDKREAMCVPCMADWQRRIRRSNPEPIREASRRRRARLKGARCDGHTEADILARGAVCWFCGAPIDLDLRHPDPMSLAINHIHPVAKGGPDILKNVAPAHARCNRQAKDRYTPAYRTWAVVPVPYPVARDALVDHHYLHRAPNVSFAFGLYDEVTHLQGVVSFGSPSSFRITRSVTSGDLTEVIELNRLWIADDAPFGVGSWFVARSLKRLPPRLVVAYADNGVTDPRYGTPHTGAIYRACSFRYGGTSAPGTEWRLPGSTRHVVRSTPGAVQVPVTPKSRYWTVTGSRTDKRRLAATCNWPSLPYSSLSPETT